jgi:hypothetical protein
MLIDSQLPGAANSVALVDLEVLYTPGLPKPRQLPGGSFGYAHRTASKGIWNSAADRFSGMILLSEMLIWHLSHIVNFSEKEQYFNQNEIQTDCERCRMLLAALESSYGTEVAGNFKQGWDIRTLEDCPSFSSWKRVFDNIEKPTEVETRNTRGKEFVRSGLDSSVAVQSDQGQNWETTRSGGRFRKEDRHLRQPST